MSQCHVTDSQPVEHAQCGQTAVDGVASFQTYHTSNFTIVECLPDVWKIHNQTGEHKGKFSGAFIHFWWCPYLQSLTPHPPPTLRPLPVSTGRFHYDVCSLHSYSVLVLSCLLPSALSTNWKVSGYLFTNLRMVSH